MFLKIMRKSVSILLCMLMIALLFSACSGKEKRINFMYPFTANVNSYDPQIAATSDEYLIIENTFEGLIRIDDDGTVKKGCADSWEISDDALTYTFHLKHGLKWNIDTAKYEEGEHQGEYKDSRLKMLGYEFDPEITANDFVFALRRAVLPETQSPMFSSVSVIENAVAVNNGSMSADSLGVSAPDDYTLVIRLSAKDDELMTTLASAVAMPCNEEFFNATKGRYGLETKYTLFNGQFYVSQILETSYLLKRNEFYQGEFPTKISQLSLRILGDEAEETGSKSVVSRLESGTYDAAFITGEQRGQISDKSGVTFLPYQDTCWAMLLNTNNEIFQNETMRQAFCLGLKQTDETGKEYLGAASNLTPTSCTIGNTSAAEQIGATIYKENTEKSMQLWQEGLKDVTQTDIEMTILTTEDMENPLKEALQDIQSGIGNIVKNENGDTITFTIKVEALPLADLETAVTKGEYDAALFPFRSSSSSPITYLKDFSANNKTGFDATAFDTAIGKAETAANNDDLVYYIRQAEQTLVDTFSVYPLFSQTSYYASASGVSDIQFHAGTGRVSFVYAERKD